MPAAAAPPSEAQVVVSLKRHLLEHGVAGTPATRVIVDADSSYRSSPFAADLEPMAAVRIDGLRPDLLCLIRTPSRSLVVGFEVKASLSDWQKGLAQAAAYRAGVHYSYLAVPAPRVDSDTRFDPLTRGARTNGIGVLLRTLGGWTSFIAPADPVPQPWKYDAVRSALEGVPVARRLQLNHPLNYLVVPLLRYLDPDKALESMLEARWPDLGTAGTRRYAIEGAKLLNLIEMDETLTPDGATVADLLTSIRFEPGSALNKRQRLEEVAPAVAAVARLVLLHQPPVRLIVDTLRDTFRRSMGAEELMRLASAKDADLAAALFLSDPGTLPAQAMGPAEFNPSTMYKFKQMLWHAGILAYKAGPGAGRRAIDYRPEADRWALEERFSRAP